MPSMNSSDHRRPRVGSEKLADNFERFNPYAAAVIDKDASDVVYGLAAIAFEISQFRYQWMKRHDRES